MKRIIKTLSVIIAAVMILASVALTASAQTASVNGKSVSVGDTVTFTATLDASTLVVNAELEVTYPSNILRLVPQENEASFPVLSKGALETNYLDGRVTAAATSASESDSDICSFSGGAVLVTLSFEVIAEGEAEIALNAKYIGGKNPEGIASEEIALVSNNTAADGVKLESAVVTQQSGSGDDRQETLIINDDITALVGQYVTVEIKIQSDYDAINIQGAIEYDSAYLELQSVSYPAYPQMVSNSTQDNAIYFTFTDVEHPVDISTESIIAKAVFKAVSAGTTQLSGVIEIMDGQNPEAPDTDIDLIKDYQTVEDSTVTETIITVSDETEQVLWGDVDHSGEISSADATLVLQKYGQLSIIGVFDETVANVNADELIDSADATLILQFYGNLITSFPAEQQ